SCQEQHLQRDRVGGDPHCVAQQRRRGDRCHRHLVGDPGTHLQGLAEGHTAEPASQRYHLGRRQLQRKDRKRQHHAHHPRPRLSVKYALGTASRSITLTLPIPPPPRSYTLLPYTTLFRSRLAKSNTFSVTASAATLTASPSSVAAGTDVTATWSGIPAPTSK